MKYTNFLDLSLRLLSLSWGSLQVHWNTWLDGGEIGVGIPQEIWGASSGSSNDVSWADKNNSDIIEIIFLGYILQVKYGFKV